MALSASARVHYSHQKVIMFPLMRLPTELRTEIYRFALLPSDHMHEHTTESPTMLARSSSGRRTLSSKADSTCTSS
ncbi:hypothetical protein HBI73_243580 [Parastagonospora nodorum]|nr:hypothetical protein HBI73_243580 [Parastagonospora nodorum]